MFNSWICDHHLILSILMAILSFVGIGVAWVLCIVIVGFTIGVSADTTERFLSRNWDKIKKITEYRKNLALNVMAGFIIAVIIYVCFFLPKYIPFILTFSCIYLFLQFSNKFSDKIFKKKSKLIEKLFSLISLAFIIYGIWNILFILYEWWILHICGV